MGQFRFGRFDFSFRLFKRRTDEPALSGIKLEPNALLEGDDNLDIPTFLRKQAD